MNTITNTKLIFPIVASLSNVKKQMRNLTALSNQRVSHHNIFDYISKDSFFFLKELE